MRGSRTQRLLAVALVMVFAGCCGPAESSSPTPTGSPPPAATAAPESEAPTSSPSSIPSSSAIPSPTLEPIPTASTYVRYPELAYVNKFVMRVAINDLSVRRKPSLGGISDGKAPKGSLFMVYDWPVQTDGYSWYYGFTLLTNVPGELPEGLAIVGVL